MSGLEVLGVLASIVQLLDCGLKISLLVREIYSKVRDAPESVSIHTAQIRQLVDTARFIERSRDLQNPRVDFHIKATLAEAERLLQILEHMVNDYSKGSNKRRIWKTLIRAGERQMLTGFERLEKEKTALILCINFVHTETLGNISDGVNELIKMANIDRNVAALGERFDEAEKRPPNPVSNCRLSSPSIHAY
jgi:hypothetical protein